MPSATPPTMRVAVEVGYVQTCPECLAITKGLADAALADPTVTRFAALPGRKHACGRATPAALPRGASAALPDGKAAPSGELFPAPPPGADGFDPDMRP